MESLTPIPTPPAQRWREFRIQALPVLTFIAVIACIAILWQRYVFPSNIVAQVEATSANVMSIVPGIIESVPVERFAKVKKGDIIAIMSIAESNVIAASVQTAQADLEVLRTRVDLGTARNDEVYQRERLRYLEEKVQLNVDRVNLKLAEANFHLQEELFTNTTSVTSNGVVIYISTPLVNSNNYLKALYQMEALQVKTTEMEQVLKEKERTLPRLLADTTNAFAAITRDIEAQQLRILAETTNLVLRAPIDGVVSVISNRPGERIMAGRPIAIITSSQSDRIIAYMRQPITTVPKPGDTLQVRRRTFKRQAAIATVQDVGSQLEPIAPALLATTGAPKVDLGLPFAIKIPAQLGLLPGEIVDILYEPKQ